MLAELTILAVLLENKYTIYRIKKAIDKEFSIFYKGSLGSIHRTLNKFEENKYVNVKKSVSSGGQKSSIYSITQKGKKHFEELMLDSELNEQIIRIKLLILPKMEKNMQITIINNIQDYYREKLLDMENYYETNPTSYIKHCISALSEEINWLYTQVLS